MKRPYGAQYKFSLRTHIHWNWKKNLEEGSAESETNASQMHQRPACMLGPSQVSSLHFC